MLTALAGGTPDRVPWAPNFDHWLNVNTRNGTLPADLRGLSRNDIVRKIGAAIWARAGAYREESQGNVRVTTRAEGDSTWTIYETPAGAVTTRHQAAPDLTRAVFLKEHMVKRVEDIEVARYLIESTTYLPSYEQFAEAEREVGEDGIALTQALRSPRQWFMVSLAGWQAGIFLEADYPDRVHALYDLMAEKQLEAVRILADSPAQVIELGDNMDATTTSPRNLRTFALPFYRECARLLHGKGKLLGSHYDGPIRALLPTVAESDLDFIEAFVPAPMGDATLAEARAALRGKVAIQGGIPAVALCHGATMESVRDLVTRALRDAEPGDGFALGMGDNVPPDADFALVRAIAGMVEEYYQSVRA